MSLFQKNKRTGGFMDEIRCDESSYLIWKWHPTGVQPGESFRENAIRCGSSLRVKDGEVIIILKLRTTWFLIIEDMLSIKMGK